MQYWVSPLWDWKDLSKNKSLPWTKELIEKYEYRWDWENLSYNKSLPWSIKLIEKFGDKWLWNKIVFNKDLYKKSLQPYLNDQVIHEVMNRFLMG